MDTPALQLEQLQKKLEDILERYHAQTMSSKAAADEIVKIREEIENLIKQLKNSQN